jgi:hypothetical protein
MKSMMVERGQQGSQNEGMHILPQQGSQSYQQPSQMYEGMHTPQHEGIHTPQQCNQSYQQPSQMY